MDAKASEIACDSGSEVIRGGNSVGHNFPPERATNSSQRSRELWQKNDDIATVRTLLFHSNRAGSKARLPERSDTITASLLKQPK